MEKVGPGRAVQDQITSKALLWVLEALRKFRKKLNRDSVATKTSLISQAQELIDLRTSARQWREPKHCSKNGKPRDQAPIKKTSNSGNSSERPAIKFLPNPIPQNPENEPQQTSLIRKFSKHCTPCKNSTRSATRNNEQPGGESMLPSGLSSARWITGQKSRGAG